jgi:hypothetical protein
MFIDKDCSATYLEQTFYIGSHAHNPWSGPVSDGSKEPMLEPRVSVLIP